MLTRSHASAKPPRRKKSVIDLNQTRAFLAVAEELHFGRAAERLGIAQPPLSRTIKQLEDRLGVQLFNRTTRFVSLTAAGSALVEPAREILRSVEKAERTVRLAEEGDIGSVNLGFTMSSGHTHVSQLIRAMQQQAPGIKVELHGKVFSVEGISRVLSGKLDMALVYTDSLPPRLAGRVISLDRHTVITPKDHPLTQLDRVTIEDIQDYEYVMLATQAGDFARENFMHWCHDAGFKPRVAQTVPDSITMAYCVNAGVGIAVNTTPALADVPDTSLVATPLETGHEPTPLVLVYHEENTSPALREVLRIAEDALPHAPFELQ